MTMKLAILILILSQSAHAGVWNKLCQSLTGKRQAEFPFHYAERTNEELASIYLAEAAQCFYAKKPSRELAIMGDQLRQNDQFNPLTVEMWDMLANYEMYERGK